MSDIAVSTISAKPTLTLLALPEDLLWTILRAILESVDSLHSPLTAAQYLAVLAQTSLQLRAVTYRFLPVGDLTDDQVCADLTLPRRLVTPRSGHRFCWIMANGLHLPTTSHNGQK